VGKKKGVFYMPKNIITDAAKVAKTVPNTDDKVFNRLLEITNKKQLPVGITDMTVTKCNGLFVRSGEAMGIILDKNLTGEKLNHVFAHELAHYQLHRFISYAFYDSDELASRRIEKEAERYAKRLVRFVTVNLNLREAA
jgi:Zn-dependent peptidase ImmA (M78 family)